MKYFSHFVIASILSSSFLTQAAPNEDSKQLLKELYIKGIPGGSVSLHRTFADQLKGQLGGEEYLGVIKECHIDANKTEEGMSSLMHSYNRIQDQYKAKVDYTKFVDLTSKIATGTGAALTGGVGGIIFTAAGVAMERTVNTALDKIEEARRAKSDLLLGHALGELREQNAAELSTRMKQPMEIAREQLLGQSGIIFKTAMWESLDPKDRPTLLRDMNLTLTDILTNEKDDRLQFQKLTSDQMTAAKTEIRKTNLALETFASSVTSDFKVIQNQQTFFKDALGSIHDHILSQEHNIAETKNDVEAIQSVLWGKMSGTERVNALKIGFFGRLPSDERGRLLDEASRFANAEKFQSAVFNITNPAKTLLGITAQLGVHIDAKVMDVVSKGINVAEGATNMVSSLMTGNYLGAVAALGSMIGIFGGGPDAGQLRHEQVMARLDQLLEGQQKIMEALNTVIKNQQLIFEAIQKLSEQVAAQHEEVMAKLDSMEKQLRALHRGINEVLKTNLDSCDVFLKVNKYTQGYDRTKKKFISFAAQRNHFRDSRSSMESCLLGLTQKVFINAYKGVSELFLTKAKDIEKAEQQSNDPKVKDEIFAEYVKKFYNPTYSLSLRLHPFFEESGFRNESLLFEALTNPLFTIGKLIEHHPSSAYPDAHIGDKAYETLSFVQPPISTLLREPVDFQELRTVMEYIIQVLPYLEMMRDTDAKSPELYTLDELRSGQLGSPAISISLLTGMIDLLNVAIAQESLTSGEFILDAMMNSLDLSEYDRSFKERRLLIKEMRENKDPSVKHQLEACETTDLYTDTVCLIEKNPYVRANLLNYLFRKTLNRTGANFFKYRVWTNYQIPGDLRYFHSDTDRTKQEIVGDLPVEYLDDHRQDGWGWYLKLIGTDGNDLHLKLPNAMSLSRGNISYTSTMDRLISWRYELQDQINQILITQDPALGDNGAQLLRDVAFIRN
ncbi:MAG: hypothetical protein JWQ35_360 [Bacteriovoracaceae bacterium]|nr:hypothetical protein [Bacteriovoracaceae bacterium]